MGKPVAGDVVVLPFPQTDLQTGKRRPALVVASLPGDDLILCQITSQARSDASAVTLTQKDYQNGRLSQDSYIRPQRLFTVQGSVVIYTAARVSVEKLIEVRTRLRELFS